VLDRRTIVVFNYSSSVASSDISVSFGSSTFFSSISVVISSMGFGGGVVAIVQPIHAPINNTATNAMKTGSI
jgi:hypothetical protein